jgi:beta-catenin-like protein 1
MLDRGNQSLHDILQTLRIFHAHIGDDDGESAIAQKNILEGLISALDSAS